MALAKLEKQRIFPSYFAAILK